MLLTVAPDVFDRIELRRVSRQKLQLDLPVLAGDKFAHQPAAMNRQPIPDDRQPAGNMSLQVLQKLDYLRSLDGAGEQAEVKVPDRNARHSRKAFPMEGVLQHRRLTSRRPGAH